MEENKSSDKFRIKPSVFVVLFIISIFFEFYWISVDPYDYFMLISIGIIALIMGLLAFEGIMNNYNRIQKERYEQNEMLIKTQKALYLATKKSAAAADIKSEQNIEAIKYLVSKMSDNQRELTALVKDNDSYARIGSSRASDISELVDKLTKSNEELAQEVQAAITVNELIKSNAELVKSVKDVLGQTITETVVKEEPIKEETPVETKPIEEISAEPPLNEETSAVEEITPDTEAFLEESSITEETSLDLPTEENLSTMEETTPEPPVEDEITTDTEESAETPMEEPTEDDAPAESEVDDAPVESEVVDDFYMDTLESEENEQPSEDDFFSEDAADSEDLTAAIDNALNRFMSDESAGGNSDTLTEAEIAALFSKL